MPTLKKAIKLHEKHMNEPKTATPASQMKMMLQMKAHQAKMKK